MINFGSKLGLALLEIMKFNLTIIRCMHWSLFITFITLLFGFCMHFGGEGIREEFYHKILYRSFRYFWDHSFSLIPMPLLWLWLLVLITILVWLFYRLLTKKVKLLSFSYFIFSLILFHGWFFYWSWGFNYFRNDLKDTFEMGDPINSIAFEKFLDAQTQKIIQLRMKLDAIKMSIDYKNELVLSNEIKPLLFQYFKGFNLNFSELGRCRILNPKGSLLIWSASGVYWPFAGEGQIDAGLSPLQYPFTYAHEYCHVMGWTDEGECNFLAYLACSSSSDVFIQYSAELSLWRYLMADARQNDKQLYQKYLQLLPNEIKIDLSEINKALNAYPEILPGIRYWFYDRYLRIHGIRSGHKSYSELVSWVIRYRAEFPSKDF
ncbi:MAG: DUF3810 domain-containing protein [Bacteroidota bacterium]|nr:DUF3810 domain-containing protein [Bacteroidota bacterium]